MVMLQLTYIRDIYELELVPINYSGWCFDREQPSQWVIFTKANKQGGNNELWRRATG